MDRPKMFSVFCHHCHRHVGVYSRSSYTHCDEEGPAVEYHFAACNDCGSPFIVGEEHYGGAASDEWVVHPPEEHLDSRVPASVRDAYQDARASLRANVFTAAALMCRRAIEATCEAKGVIKGNLKQRLLVLRDIAILDARVYEWAEALRGLGNDAAHDLQYRASKEEAHEAIEFTRALVEAVFVIDERFKEFKRKRAAVNASAHSPPALGSPGQPSQEPASAIASNVAPSDENPGGG